MRLRESGARLLADPRTTEPRARLAQAVSRSEFIGRAARALGGTQSPLRGMEALIDLLLGELVDVAHVVLRKGDDDEELVASGSSVDELHTWTTHRGEALTPALSRVMDQGTIEEVVVPATSFQRDRLLASLLTDDRLAHTVPKLRVENLVLVPLATRGRFFGVLVLGRSHGLGFSGSHPFLIELAERVAASLDTHLALAESRHVARLLTASLAPEELPDVPGLTSAVYFRAAHRAAGVGGDYFSLHGPSDDLTLLCGDVSGKGIKAALLAKRIRNAVRTGSLIDRDPGFLLGLVNQVLVDEEDHFSEAFSTAVCLRLRPADGGGYDVAIANAGHPAALRVGSGSTVLAIEVEGMALGLVGEAEFGVEEFRLLPGELLVLHTDGVTEARSARDEQFGEARLTSVLAQIGGMTPRAAVQAVALAVDNHVDGDSRDDLAILAVQPKDPTA